MCICKLFDGSYFRRLDIKFYPLEQFGLSLIHFTGSKNFNASLRLIARKKGYLMNDRGFYLLDKNNKKAHSEPILKPFPTEASVFEFLNIEFKAPNERNL